MTGKVPGEAGGNGLDGQQDSRQIQAAVLGFSDIKELENIPGYPQAVRQPISVSVGDINPDQARRDHQKRHISRGDINLPILSTT
jgi:hypothetical protein